MSASSASASAAATLSITNKEIYDFYKTHNIDFEQTNILVYTMLKQMVDNMDKSVNSKLANQLLKSITVVNAKVDKMNDNMQTFQNTVIERFSLKFNDFRQEYMRDITAILNTNTLENISPLIKDTTAHFIDKTSTIIGEIVPQHHKPIMDRFDLFHNHITNETKRLLDTSNKKDSMEIFLNSVNTTMNQTYNTLTTLITASEGRIENKLNNTDRQLEDLKSAFQSNDNAQSQLQTNVAEMLKKFEKGIGKGTVSEHVTINILQKMYGDSGASIEHVGQTAGMGDIMFQRIDKPRILIEVKDHNSTSVPKTDVQKFINDCQGNKCSGIMFAHNRPITHKNDYQIDIHGDNVLLYVGNVNFDEERINTAINIVEMFKKQLDNYTVNRNNYSIDNAVLEAINADFNAYISQKHNLVRMVKDFNSQMLDNIQSLKMPNLESYLGDKFATTNKVADTKCPYCDASINASFKGHLRYCKKKPKNLTEAEIMSQDARLAFNSKQAKLK